MEQERSTFGGRLPGAANSMPFLNVPEQPIQQHFSLPTMGSGSHQHQPTHSPEADRSRRRPFTSLYCSIPMGSSIGARARNYENHSQGHLMNLGTLQFYPHPTFRPPNANVVSTPSVFGAPGIPIVPSQFVQPGSPREPKNKMFKLEMNIDSSDRKISGKLITGDTQMAAATRATPSGAGKSPLASNGEEKSQREAMGSWNLGLLEQMNRQFDQKSFQLLQKVNSELMTDVGAISCYLMAGLVAERKYIQEEVLHRMSRPDLFDGIRRYRTAGIFLCGPAGNGKTVMAKLIAGNITRRYINVQPYYLDSPMAYQLLIAIFRLASNTEPSVIVFENIDQMFRGKNGLQELFVSEFERSMQRRDHVVVVGTSRMDCYHNLPKKIVHCFHHRIKIQLPDERERRDLVSAFMKGVPHKLTKSNFKDIADATANRTRGQIEAICRKVASIPSLQIPNELIRIALPSSIRQVTITDFITVLNLRHFPNSPEPIGDSSSMEISSVGTSQESPVDEAAHRHGRSNFSANDIEIGFH